VNSTEMAAVRSSPRAVLSGWLRQDSSPQAVSSFLPRLTRKAFEKYGFASVSLLTDWASIVGADIASYTVPERLKWPRVSEVTDDPDSDGARPGATLIVRVDGPRAIELQHKAQQIIERINAAFGYRAVAELRFIQAPIETGPPKGGALSSPAIEEPSAEIEELTSVQDDTLRQALSRLALSIRREKQARALARSRVVGGR